MTSDQILTTGVSSKSEQPSLRALIVYEHCSPHQVAAVEAARLLFAESGNYLIPLECYSGSTGYGWTFADRSRPPGWLCLFPGQQQAESKTIVKAVRQAVREHHVDVLVINGWYGKYAWPLIYFKKKLGCRVVMVSDSNNWDKPRTFLREWAKRVLLRKVDAGFAAGTPQKEYLVELGMQAERIALGNDVVDPTLYSSIPLRTVPNDRPIIFGTAARLIPEKNLLAALHAFAAVVKRHPSWQIVWHIAGKGPLEQTLRQAAADLHAPVEFVGFIGYYDMPKFYVNLDIYWQPSIYEPWGLVVNEAMTAGLPVLVSDRCGCARDLVGPDNGWIHDVSSLDALTVGLETALQTTETWPLKSASSRQKIAAWGPSRFAAGLLQACRFCYAGS